MSDKKGSDKETGQGHFDQKVPDDDLKPWIYLIEVQSLLPEYLSTLSSERKDKKLFDSINAFYRGRRLSVALIKKILKHVDITEEKVSEVIERIHKREKKATEDALKALVHIDEVQSFRPKKGRTPSAESEDQKLIDAITTLFHRHHQSIKSIKTILKRVDITEEKVSEAIERINKLEEEEISGFRHRLLFEKLFIMPPNLQPAYINFEAHLAVSGKVPILILGPTGVGKSLFLYLAKNKFKKNNKDSEIAPPVVEANCAHFSGGSSGYEMSRSELFGHVEGAYTGAISYKKGLVEKADGGMLILEEVGELPLEVQAMLLTFIETGEYRRLGDENIRRATVKIVAATNRESVLRPDFRYRFFSFSIPPLHLRREDILYYFYEIFPDLTKRFTRSEVLLLLSYNWPGNVREIERVGRLLMRNKWRDDKIASDDPNSRPELRIQRLWHIGPEDISLDPDKSLIQTI